MSAHGPAFGGAVVDAMLRITEALENTIEADPTHAAMAAARGADIPNAARLHHLAVLGAACAIAGRMDASLAAVGEPRSALDRFALLVIQSARADVLRAIHAAMPPPTQWHIEEVARTLGVDINKPDER